MKHKTLNGDWGLGIGPNPQSPIPNPQSPIPNNNTNNFNFSYFFCKLIYNKKYKFILFNFN